MKNKMFLAIVSAVVLFVTPVLADDHDKAEAKKTTKAETYRLLNLFGDVFERVRSDYVEEATDEELIEAAITGMLSSLDPHSSFLNADGYRDMQVQTRGRFGGLGIEVTMQDGLVKVVSPIDDTPAFRAGIQSGDLIYKLDEEAVMGLTLAEAVERMRGKVGTDIILGVRRKDQDDFDVTITRAVIKIRSVRSRMEGKIGYLRITSFSAQAYAGVKKAMAKFRDEVGDDLQGVVLDLRNNPGGLLGQAVDVSDAFMERGEIVSTRSRQPEDTQRYNATPGDLADGLPIVVLLNGGSASASEIVAGALQDHKRAILLGTKSFGKGSVQTIIPLSGQGAMRLTTARYFTPSGRSIQAVGIEPDIKVEQAKLETVTRPKGRREADLRGALENGNKKKDADKDTKSDSKADASKDKKDAKPQDYQLARALDLIRGVSMFQGAVSAKQ
ncbi:MAG: S41 family peptidase [Rhodospirillaceae bacterium]|jgi:carboxyl-terminal processing protease|nr:S41 family peptidase [Rhodospirillaceae bacterium]MBT4464347.1 S41 family peptidase [Rhodospirillaceae bacterium]MBT5309746.1 S41 family peptidase [Rhodospirillaceae bacterium]MBT7354968.1 S41 family peptidase [Rhodospirillaceae bacterium]